MMKKVLAAVVSATFLVSFSPVVGSAETACPEVDAAKAMLKQQTASDVKAPRSLAGARSQDMQAPRSQNVQAPRSQDVQAPRSQNIQAPRSQDVQAPRSQDVQAPRAQDGKNQSGAATRGADLKKAASLVKEADAACKAGKGDMAAEKAKAAMALMKK
jgi:hypothetical protein